MSRTLLLWCYCTTFIYQKQVILFNISYVNATKKISIFWYPSTVCPSLTKGPKAVCGHSGTHKHVPYRGIRPTNYNWQSVSEKLTKFEIRGNMTPSS